MSADQTGYIDATCAGCGEWVRPAYSSRRGPETDYCPPCERALEEYAGAALEGLVEWMRQEAAKRAAETAA